MRILVTGGAGFIGSHVVDAYIAEGHDVVIVDNLSTGRIENVNPDAEFIEMSINDSRFPDVLAQLRPEIVSHHAAQMDVRVSVQDPIFDAEENVLGSVRLIEAAVNSGVKKIVYASTGGAVYGEVKTIPVTEDTIVAPVCHYGVSKHTVEHYLFVYCHLGRMDYTALRYPNVYGPRQSPSGEAGVIAIFAGQMLRGQKPTIFGDGTKKRDYVHVSDIVHANLIALDRGSGRIYNLGSGCGTSDREIFDAVASVCGYEGEPEYAPVRPGEVHQIALDSTRAREELGWCSRVPLDQGIRETVDFIRTTELESAEQ